MVPGAVLALAGFHPGARRLAEHLASIGSNLAATASDIAGGSAVNDGQPSGDVCASRDSFFYTSSSKNIGDLLNAAHLTWGWFQGGFDLTITQFERNQWLEAESVAGEGALREGPRI